jgi:DNA-binding NtrC family response regulator
VNSKPYRICLIEDDEIMGEALLERFELEGFECDWSKTGLEARRALENRHYDVAISDIQLPDINGEDLFVELKESGIKLPPFIFTTGYGTIDRAVRLLKLGAHDYLTKPMNTLALLDRIRFLCSQSRPAMLGENTLGISSSMRALESLLPRLAQTQTSVLITGESGVGKERLAQALHRQTDPGGRTPFVAVNCGALTESLLEAELFGYVKGAFTGAAKDKKGLFEQAHGGILFLDEIGEMSPAMQVKLLRAIQERQITRVGAESPTQIAIRLVCATHRDLKNMVELGKFREDLYYRIHVIHLHIPPLRERKEDIVWLAKRLLDTWGSENSDVRTLHPAADKSLLAYPWPGNIRELKHCLERACVLTRDSMLTAEMLFDASPPAPDDAATTELLNDHLQVCEKRFIEDSLLANNRRISETATALGISRKNLWEKMKKHNIQTNTAE